MSAHPLPLADSFTAGAPASPDPKLTPPTEPPPTSEAKSRELLSGLLVIVPGSRRPLAAIIEEAQGICASASVDYPQAWFEPKLQAAISASAEREQEERTERVAVEKARIVDQLDQIRPQLIDQAARLLRVWPRVEAMEQKRIAVWREEEGRPARRPRHHPPTAELLARYLPKDLVSEDLQPRLRSYVEESDLLDEAQVLFDERERERIARLRQGNVREIGRLAAEHDDSTDLVPRMLRHGDRVILTGRPGQGKSTLWRQFSVQVAAGLWPFQPERRLPNGPVRVLYVDLENDPLDAGEAFDSLLGLLPNCIEDLPLHWEERQQGYDLLTSDEDRESLRRLALDFDTDVLVIGPLFKAAGALQEESKAGPLLRYLDALKDEADCAMLIEAHPTKSVGDGSPLGSAVLAAWAPAGFYLKPGGELHRFRPLRRTNSGWPTHLRRGGAGAWPWVSRTPTDDDVLGQHIREAIEDHGVTSKRKLTEAINTAHPDERTNDSAVGRWTRSNPDEFERFKRDAGLSPAAATGGSEL